MIEHAPGCMKQFWTKYGPCACTCDALDRANALIQKQRDMIDSCKADADAAESELAALRGEIERLRKAEQYAVHQSDELIDAVKEAERLAVHQYSNQIVALRERVRVLERLLSSLADKFENELGAKDAADELRKEINADTTALSPGGGKEGP